MDREYSAVDNYSIPSYEKLELEIFTSPVTVEIVSKPSLLYDYIEKGRAKIISEIIVDQLGSMRYVVETDTKYKDEIISSASCYPLSFSMIRDEDLYMEDMKIKPIKQLIISWCSKFLEVEVGGYFDIEIQKYKDGVILFLPRHNSEYLYVTQDERMSINLDVDKFKGLSFLSRGPLAKAALEEQRFPTAKQMGGLYVYDSVVDRQLDQEFITDMKQEISGIEQILSSNGDMIIEKDDPNFDLIKEICLAWNLENETMDNGDLYIYKGNLSMINIHEAVREILLNHPPTLFTSDMSLESTSSMGEFRKDVRVMVDTKTIPCWSLKDLNREEPNKDVMLPEIELIVDPAGVWIDMDSRSILVLEIRQSDKDNVQALNELRDLSRKLWEGGYMISQWGKHMIYYYGVVSIFLLRRPPVFDTVQEAIIYLRERL